MVVQGVSTLAALPFAGEADFGLYGGVGVSDATVVHLTDLNAAVGKGATVTALGLGAASNVYTGKRVGLSQQTTPIHGLAVTATAYDDLAAVAVGAAGSGGAGIAGSSVVNLLLERTRATIDSNARVNQVNLGAGANQSVYLEASNLTEMGDVAGVLAVGTGQAAGGAGADIGVSLKDTEAAINDSAAVSARGDIVVRADRSLEYVLSVAAAGSVGQRHRHRRGCGRPDARRDHAGVGRGGTPS